MSDDFTAADLRALTTQMSALVQRIDRLVGLMEGALAPAASAPNGGAPSGGAPSGGAPSGGPGASDSAPTREPVSGPSHGGPSAAPAAPPASGATAVAPMGALDVPLDEFGDPLPGDWTGIEELLIEVFRAALHDDAEFAFKHYRRLMHTETIAAPQALTHLEVFQWRKLRERARDYLQSGADPASFTVARRIPEAPSQDDVVCKVFLKCRGREPVPTRFRRDAAVGHAWRIESSSL